MDPPTGQPSLSPFSQPSTSPSSNTKTVIIAVLITVVITSLIVAIICFFYQKLRLRKQKPNSSPFNATPDNPLLDTRIRSHFWRFQGGTGNTVNGSPAVKQDSVLTPSIASKQNGNFGGNNHASNSIANLDSVSTWSVSSKQNDSFIANVQGSLPKVEGQVKMAGSQLELGNPEQVGRVGFQALSMPVSLTKTQELSNFGRLHKNNEALTACMPMAASLAPPSQKPVHGPEQSARFSDDSGEAGNDSADLTLGPFWMSSTEQQSHATVGSAVLHTLNMNVSEVMEAEYPPTALTELFFPQQPTTTKTSHSVSSVNAFSLNAPLPEQQLAMATEVSVSEQSSLPMGHTLSEHRNSINAAQSLAETFGPLAAPPLHAASGELPFGSTATDSFTSQPWPVSERPSTTAPAAFNFTPQLVPPLPLPPALVSAAILNAQRQKSASLADKIHSSIPVKSVAAAFASQATETKVVSSSSVGEISSSIPVKSVAAAFASQSYQADAASSAFSAGEIHFSIPVKSVAAAFASSQASQAETTVLPSSFSLPYSSKQVTSSDTHFALSNTKMTTIYSSSFPPSSANALTSQASQPPQAISPLAFPDVTTGQSLIQPTASLTGVSHAPMDEARLPYDLVSTANASNAWQTSASFPEGALASSGKTTFTAPQSVTASLPNQHFQSYSAALTSVGLSQKPSQQLTFHGDSHFAVSASETDQPSALPFCPPYSAAVAGENLEVSSVHTYNKIPPFHSVSTAPVEGAAELYPALVSQHIPSAGNVPPPPAPPPPPIMAQAVPHPKAASLSVGTKGSPPPPPPPPPPPTSHLPTVGTKGSPAPLPPPPLVSNSSSADVVPPLSNVKEPPPPPPLLSINGPPAPSLSSSKGPPAPPPHPLGTTKGPPPPPPPPLPFTKDPSAPPPPPLPIPKGPSSSPSLPSTKGPPPPPPPPLPSTKGHPAPPPPPNAKGPPPPPPPNAKGPPPPPPLPGAKGPPRAPVPPPPPGSKGPPPPPAPFAPPAPPGSAPRPPHTSKPPQVPQQDLAQNVQKLKPLHWDKVRASNSMVWDKLKTGSFVLDEKEIATLFGTSANVKKEVGKSPAPAKRKAILDSKKAHFIAIQLRALNISTQDICDALLEGDGMKAELLEVLVKMSPTQEEQKALLDFSGDRSELGPAERFLKAVLEIPNAFQRLQAMQYKACFKDDLSQVQESLQILEAACVQVKENRLFLKLLEAVLKTGNRMNKGTNRGEAEAFKLDTLLKLSDVKSADGKTTLLHFVAEEIIKSEGLKAMHATSEGDPSTRKMPEGQKNEDDVKRRGLEVVLQLCTELGSVKKAAGVDADALSQSVLKLASGLLSIQNRLKTSFQVQAQLSGIFPTEDSFGARMEVFCSKAEDDVAKAKEDISRVFDKVKQATTYFHGNLKETQPLRLFVIVSDFLSILEKVCKDLAKPLKMNIRG